jgi:hypothetical protein
MINKKILAAIFLLFILLASGAFINYRNHHLSVDLIESKQGWGYNILYRNKVIIHQPYMPAMGGQIAFQNKNAAKKTGLLVVKKLRNNQLPGIKADELNSIIKDTD